MLGLFARLVIVATLALPIASASVTQDAGVLVIEIHDAHRTDCSPQGAGICAVEVENATDPGNATIDARQKPTYIAAATDLPAPLPEVNETIRGSQLHANQTVLETATVTYNAMAKDLPEREKAGLHMGEDGIWAYWSGPRPLDPLGPSGDRTQGVEYGDPGDVPAYRDVGPFNLPIDFETDERLPLDEFVCHNQPDSCDTYRENVTQRIKDNAPNVKAGIEYDTLQVATDPNNLNDPRATNESPQVTMVQYHEEGQPGPNQERRSHDEPTKDNPQEPESPTKDPATTTDETSTEPAKARVSTVPPTRPPSSKVPLTLVAATAAVTISFLALVAWALYARLATPEAILKNPKRNRIAELARNRPGLTFQQIASIIELSRTTTAYHVRMLHQAKLVRIERHGKTLHVHPSDPRPASSSPSHREGQRLLLALLESKPEGCTRLEIQSALSHLPKRSRNYSIRRLLDLGAIRAETHPGRGEILKLHRENGRASAA